MVACDVPCALRAHGALCLGSLVQPVGTERRRAIAGLCDEDNGKRVRVDLSWEMTVP